MNAIYLNNQNPNLQSGLSSMPGVPSLMPVRRVRKKLTKGSRNSVKAGTHARFGKGSTGLFADLWVSMPHGFQQADHQHIYIYIYIG